MPETTTRSAAVAAAHQSTAARVAQVVVRMGNEPRPDLQPADASGFDARQRRHADRAGAQLTAAGFGHLADVEAVHLRALVGRPMLLRLHVSHDGSTVAATWRMVPRAGLVQRVLRRLMRSWTVAEAVELKTAVDDGTQVVTRVVGDAPDHFGPPPQHDVLTVPAGTPVHELVGTHSTRVAAHLATRPGAQVVPSPDLAAVERVWAAESVVRSAYRRSIGYATDEELRAVMGKHHATLGPLVRDHLDRLADVP